MGNLKARLKATLLRRDSKPFIASPSKNSFGRDCASSASTNTQPGHDESDEPGDPKAERSQTPSKAPARVVERPLNESGRDDQNSKNSRNSQNSQTRQQKDDDDHVQAQTHKAHHFPNLPSLEREEAQVQAQAPDPAPVPAPAPAPTPAPIAPAVVAPAEPRPSTTSTTTKSKTAPQSILQAEETSPLHPLQKLGQPDPGPTSNSNATTDSGNDLQNIAADNSHSPSSTTGTDILTTDHPTIPTTSSSPVVITSSSTGAATVNSLPSIHEHPATPPSAVSAVSASPGLEDDQDIQDVQAVPAAQFASSESRPAFVNTNTDHTRDNTVTDIDDQLRSPSLLTPPAISTLLSTRPPLPPSPFSRPLAPYRKQSLFPANQTHLFKALLHGHADGFELDAVDPDQQPPLSAMVTRKIWVKRPLASATLITISEDDLVDDVRELILRKYTNSLGRLYDAPDLTLRICNREQQTSRLLQPDEPMCKVLDSYYPGGQSVDDALLIDIPSRRTPKASPNPRYYADDRPHESGTDYFPPYPPPTHAHSHHSASAALVNGQHNLHFPPSMSIVGGSQLPPLPSPGSTRRLALNRPNMQRMHTASPGSTVANSHVSQTGAAATGTHKHSRPVRSRTHSGASSDQSNHAPQAPPIPTPPAAERIVTPPPRVSSPRPSNRAMKKTRRAIETPSLPSGLLDTAVPPINILIVEDNMINLRLLEAFVKRLKVRWQTAVNGREAVDKWRAGGFHLVLMDIQLPIMNGLEATREIRRIEKVNSIGVFSSSASSPPDEVLPEPAEEDKLANTEMFKSPVIIVALTASSLQSDRHEALAAGCNDFLTKVSLLDPIPTVQFCHHSCIDRNANLVMF